MKTKKSTEKKQSGKIPFTIVLDAADMDKLQSIADAESRPRAQMARVLLERAIRAANK
jgi:predicted transcriptional regulator